MRLYLLFLLSFSLTAISSCKKYRPAEEAFFIRPGKITVNTFPGQGSGTHRISDIWVYVNHTFRGAYPTGNLIPVPHGGQQAKVEFYAGIKNNGISETRLTFPFYNKVEFDTLVAGGKTIDMNVAFSYRSNTTFTWTENFDSGLGFTLINSSISEVSYTLAPGATGEGNAAYINLPAGKLVAQVESSQSYDLPESNPNVFLELDYKCNAEFVAGLITSIGQLKDAIVITPKSEWNKIYIDLSNLINSEPRSDEYKIYFRMLKNENPGTQEMYIDNVKLLHF